MSARVTAGILKMLLANATPGKWDAFNSHVSALIPPSEPDNRYSRSDPDSHSYYGGELVCESCSAADALLIAAMQNLLPSLITEHVKATTEIARLRSDLRFARAEIVEQKALTDLVRSQRYQPLQYPPAQVLGVRYHKHGLYGWEDAEAAD